MSSVGIEWPSAIDAISAQHSYAELDPARIIVATNTFVYPCRTTTQNSHHTKVKTTERFAEQQLESKSGSRGVGSQLKNASVSLMAGIMRGNTSNKTKHKHYKQGAKCSRTKRYGVPRGVH
jgi:hypothetical protein